MTVDVIAGYYKQAHRLPTFHWGIEANRFDINKVFVVSDGPYEVASDYPFTFLSHPKSPAHGNGVNLNQGAYASRADYLLFTGTDLILQPGAVKAALDKADPRTLVIGAVDCIPDNTTVADLPNPQVLLVDMDDRNQRFKTYGNSPKSYYLARNGHTLVHRETFLALGGFDEKFAEEGYGYEDYEFGLRWCKTFTGKNIVRSGARAWHFSGDAPILQRTRPSDKALKHFLLCEAAYHGGRLKLFDKTVCADSATVTHLTPDIPADFRAVDCNDLTWIPPLSLTYLATRPDKTLDAQKHIIDCWGKLANGGDLHLIDFKEDHFLDALGDVTFIDPSLGNIIIRKNL